jgi:hypothetical protein
MFLQAIDVRHDSKLAMSKIRADLTLDQIMERFSTDEAARWPSGSVWSNASPKRSYDIAANPPKKIRAGVRECAVCCGSFTLTVGKRGLNGTFHHIGHQYLDQYLGEFDFRFNYRDTNDGERTFAPLKKAHGKRLMSRPRVGRH